ncbi:MAG TPA: class I SAM-dependent methyltransferase [Flavisolibacter sp.]|jgi:demethylmenaquinone methyltransferase/2-methoxy-6-polyprenyl-1,4-benzoquinol methylase|nr:class I SAM-dependent methyltransferase [Flavisolibacter sp.]
MHSDIVSYYRDRAKEYEKIYDKPERQSDLLLIEKILQDVFRNKTVYEIACGTGYWTQKIAKTARSIVATDINDTVLEIAKAKDYSTAVLRFEKADIFNLEKTDRYESLFGGFIWSHIKLQDLPGFSSICNRLVGNGGTVVFIDNKYVEGSSLPITSTDDGGNTFQTRKLENGTTHTVLKNFPSKTFILELLTEKGSDIQFTDLQYYWMVKYNAIV